MKQAIKNTAAILLAIGALNANAATYDVNVSFDNGMKLLGSFDFNGYLDPSTESNGEIGGYNLSANTFSFSNVNLTVLNPDNSVFMTRDPNNSWGYYFYTTSNYNRYSIPKNSSVLAFGQVGVGASFVFSGELQSDSSRDLSFTLVHVGTNAADFSKSISLEDNSGNSTISYKAPATAVPETDVYAMMMAGLGLIGFKLRKRILA